MISLSWADQHLKQWSVWLTDLKMLERDLVLANPISCLVPKFYKIETAHTSLGSLSSSIIKAKNDPNLSFKEISSN